MWTHAVNSNTHEYTHLLNHARVPYSSLEFVAYVTVKTVPTSVYVGDRQ